MKRAYLFISITSAALIVLFIIQINWIWRTAEIKENLFNEKANLVLAKTTEAIGDDEETCRKIVASFGEDEEESIPRVGKHETEKIDSLFNHYMKVYNIQIDYTFVLSKTRPVLLASNGAFTNTIFNGQIGREEESTLELQLIFPDKKQFILAEMGPMFITSVSLIIIVLLLFWRTAIALANEKRISAQTSDFLNNMTHEFKTPLTNIGLAAKMMKRETEAVQSEKLKNYQEIILSEKDKLGAHVEQVLGIAALERGELLFQKETLNLHELLEVVGQSMRIQVEEEGMIGLNLEASNALIEGDRVHLSNAISNLIDNGIKYSNGKPELTITTFNKENHLFCIVADKGIGIDKKYLDQVFDKFYRIQKGDIHNVKGFGLGLSYVKKIVELHQGTIRLESESEKGKGTNVIIQLPNA